MEIIIKIFQYYTTAMFIYSFITNIIWFIFTHKNIYIYILLLVCMEREEESGFYFTYQILCIISKMAHYYLQPPSYISSHKFPPPFLLWLA